jgi:hypothetical protein
MSENIKTAALLAGLQGESKKQVDDLTKSLFVHKELSNLPKEVATAKFAKLPADQQEDLVKKYGTEDPMSKPSRGWFSTAWHYATLPVVEPAKLAFKGVIEVSDAMTRTYRAVAIPLSQGEIGFAWDKANDKGDKVFNEGRIEKAKKLYGQDAVDIAMRIKAGEAPQKIWASATPEQKKYLMLDDPQNKTIPGVADVEKARALWNETLGVVDRSKFSPGRQIANAILPEALEKNELVYNIVSGSPDAAYRLFVDPLVVGSKLRALYVVGKYSLDVVTGGKKVSEYFANPTAVSFWDNYGAKLDEFTKAQKAGNTKAMVAHSDELKRLAPEYGPEVIRGFQKANEGRGITNAISARAFLENTEEAVGILKGSVGRKRVILPRLDAQRKARVSLLTTADKMFDIDKIASPLMNALHGAPVTTDGILKALREDNTLIGKSIKELTNPKGFDRLSTAAVAMRLDRFKAKFSIAPIFKDDEFNVMAPDATTLIYRFARLVMPKEDAKMISQTFETMNMGQRKEAVKGLWGTVAEVRGLNLTEAGQKIVRQTVSKGDSRFAVANFGDDFADIGMIPSDYNPVMSMPSIVDIDRAAARSGLISKMMGQANKQWVDDMTGVWSFLTLAGPRYAVRNAGEDLMVHLAIGGTPWGLAKNRYLATRINTGLNAARTSKTWSDNNLGLMLRMINKKESAKFESRLAGLDDLIRDSKEQIKIKQDLIKATKDPAVKASLASEIETIKESTKGGAVHQTRLILAEALTSGRINRYRKSLGMKPMFEDEVAILAEHLVYGNLDNVLAHASESASNFATGGDMITRSTNFTRAHGVRSEALVVSDPKAKDFTRKKGDASYDKRAIAPQDDGSMLTWLYRMRYYANDEAGAIAVANLDNKDLAITKIKEWMKNNPTFRDEAQFAAQGFDEQKHAEYIYSRGREIFEKRAVSKGADTELNLELLNKIRTQDDKGDWVISGKMSLDDLPTNSADIPEYVLGPLLVPVSDSGNIAASLVTRGWTWLGLANARLSRQPMVLNEVIDIRKQMKKSGFEDAYIKSVVSKVDSTNPSKIASATERAKRQLAEIVEERALSQTLQYVDNPLIRTQLAFTARNFSRFYRATEDFYRRMYRVTKYNPMAIRKAALTYDGISHNGFIQEDDQGEKYFVYPGVEPMYRAVQSAMTALGIPAEFKTPFPVQFGAQVKMLTPSLNQDSIIPTFSGPLAGVSMKVLTNLIDVAGAPGAADNITSVTMGKYSVGRSFVSSFLPAHINRLYETMSTDDRDSQYASAWRKAVTYLEASGHGLPEKYDELGNLIPPTIAEREKYRQSIKNTTLNILGTRFVFGFFAPASPQVQLKSDMAQWISDNGVVNFKTGFSKLLDEYDADYDKAMARWIELFPNEVVFTLSESEKKTVAVVRYADESGAFVEQNKALFDAYPQGAAFLIPHKSGFSWDAYKTMKDMGLRYNKNVDDYLRETQTASDLQTYYAKKNEYESGLETMFTDFERSMARDEFDTWAKTFKAGRPLLQEELDQGGKKAIERMNAISDLRNMLNDKKVTVRGPVQKALKAMIDVYDEYKLEKEALEALSGTSRLVSIMKDDTIVTLRELSQVNENTKSAYNTLFASLLGDTNG